MSQPVNTVKKPVSIKKTILRVLLYFVVLRSEERRVGKECM